MNLENFVILILCSKANLDDLMYERQKHQAVAVDIIPYVQNINYFNYRERYFNSHSQDIDLMFVFGKNDSVIVKNETDISTVNARLSAGDC